MSFTHYLFLILLSVQISFGQSDTDLRRIVEQAKSEAPSVRRDSLLLRTYLALADQYTWGSSRAPANHDSAVFFATEAIQVAPTSRLRADALLKRGSLYHSNDLGFTSAWMGLDDLNQAGNAYIRLRDTSGLQKTYAALATLYLIRYDPKGTLWANSLHYATLIMRTQSDPTFQFPKRLAAPATDSPATLTQVREAIRVGEQNLAFWQRKGDKQYQMWRLEYLGRLYHQSRLDAAKGKAYQKQALELALMIPDIHIAFACLTNLAQWELDDGNLSQSLRYARQGLSLSQQHRIVFRQASFHDRLYHTFRAMRQMDSAYTHKDATIAINDSLSRVGDQRQIQFLKEKNIAQKRQHELEQVLQQQNNVLYLLVSVGVLLAGIVALFVWRNRLLNRKNAELKAALLQGQTTERQRVAADLHDNLGTTLSALQWNLEAMDKSRFTATEQSVYEAIHQQVSQVYMDVRLLSHNLLPDELEKQGLAVALRTLVDKMNRNTLMHFYLTGADTLPRLNRQTEFELYSICLELINNSLKHAKATEGFVGISQADGILNLTVGDNGVGLIDPDGQRGEGRGLQNVAARVNALSGTWSVESVQGVQHRITVPIKIQAHVSSQT